MLAFGKLPLDRRTPLMENAIEKGVEFLLGVDPAEEVVRLSREEQEEREEMREDFEHEFELANQQKEDDNPGDFKPKEPGKVQLDKRIPTDRDDK